MYKSGFQGPAWQNESVELFVTYTVLYGAAQIIVRRVSVYKPRTIKVWDTSPVLLYLTTMMYLLHR